MSLNFRRSDLSRIFFFITFKDKIKRKKNDKDRLWFKNQKNYRSFSIIRTLR